MHTVVKLKKVLLHNKHIYIELLVHLHHVESQSDGLPLLEERL